ncbi:MAG: OFA family MFS transporter [Candidatus Aenigmarchaeota archaeon]|nr:OFA family MFS transporter [Candidatus Aenigmarchaeota archaeon]
MKGILSNRWFVVIGALLMQLCLGAIYAWSVFVNPLKNYYAFTTTETQIIFSVALATFAGVMIFAGRWQDKIGPKKVGLIGAALLGLGYFLAGFTEGSFLGLVVTIGLIGGAGIGFGYVCPIAALIKWFPDKRGLISGIAVASFGAGAWVFAQLASVMIPSIGILATFSLFGIIYFVFVFIGALMLRNPPKGWAPKGWESAKKDKKSTGVEFEWRTMVKTHQFWLLWIMFIIGASAGFIVIGNLAPYGVFSGLTAEVAASAVGLLALFNGAGRIVWGTLSDKIGRTKAMTLMFVLQGIMMLVLISMGSSPFLLAIAAAWVGFNFGGNFSLFPSVTADYFGTKNMGMNYALVFTSYGVAGILGPILAGSVFDMTGSYLWAFIPAGIACLVAAGISLLVKKPNV